MASINPSPGKIYFNTESGDRVCEKIGLSSEDYQGKIKVRDVWATNINEGSNINRYTANPQDFWINLEYLKIIDNFNGNQEIEICINQKEPMKAKGGIIFTPESETNVVVEYGVWLLINLEEPETIADNVQKNQQNPSTNQNTNTQSAATNSNSGQVQLLIDQVKKNTQIREEQTTADGITGAAVGTNNKRISLVTIIIIVGIIGAFIALFTYRSIKRRRRFMEYGY